MSLAAAILMLIAQVTGGQGPCKAVHYGREGYKDEVSMAQVVTNRLTCPGPHCTPGFHPRADVTDFIAVRWADRWRVPENWRALVVFHLPSGGYSSPLWLQPADYQAAKDVRSSACRVETSEKLAASQGWSLWQGWGLTTATIIRWER